MSYASELTKRFEAEISREYLGLEKPVNKITPLVSVSVITYNQKNYIRQCLEGILMQQVNFPMEIVIGDDGSSDGTTEICKEYADRFPDKIRLFIRERNTSHYYENGKYIWFFNGHWSRMSCKGKYVAICEGDDYWIDPLKLQKQVDFLEKNPDYSLCFTNARVLAEGKLSKIHLNIYAGLETREYTGEEILKKWTIPTASVLYRNNNVPIVSDNRFVYEDIIIFLVLAQMGRIYCINEHTAVYRRGVGLTFTDKVDYKRRINHYLAIKEHFGEKYDRVLKTLIAKAYVIDFVSGKLGKKSFSILWEVITQPKYLLPFLAYLPVHIYYILYDKVFILRNRK